MSIHPIAAAVHTLLAADREGCDRAALAERAALLLQVRSWVDALEVEIAADAARLGEPAAELLTVGGRRKAREADAVIERAAVLESMPSMQEALAAGSVSAGHVDAVVRAAGRLDAEEREDLVDLAPELVAAAACESVEAFERDTRKLVQLLSRDGGLSRHERLRRQRSLRRWVDAAGLHHTHVTLDPESDAKFSAALDAGVAAERSKGEDPDGERTFEQLKADAFVSLVTGVRVGERRHPEVLVLVDHDTLVAGCHERSVCETNDGASLPVATVRRMCCEADIIPVVLNGEGAALDVGRSRSGGHRITTAGVAVDVPHVRLPGLRGALRGL
jgi:hypothetical protein